MSLKKIKKHSKKDNPEAEKLTNLNYIKEQKNKFANMTKEQLLAEKFYYINKIENNSYFSNPSRLAICISVFGIIFNCFTQIIPLSSSNSEINNIFIVIISYTIAVATSWAIIKFDEYHKTRNETTNKCRISISLIDEILNKENKENKNEQINSIETE